MNRQEMAEKMLKHLEAGGHISDGNEQGFSTWNVDKWPLRTTYIFHSLEKIQEAIRKVIKDLDEKANLRPFPPFRLEEKLSEKDVLMANHLPNFEILIDTYLSNILEDLLILDRWINNEIIE